MTEIVVLGGGFAGVSAAKELKKLSGEQLRITLVDRNPYHLFIPSLYEVATAEEPRNNICIPFSEIFPHGVRFIKGEAIKINKDAKEIEFRGGQILKYDYLVIALGSESDYRDIPGLKENSISFKSLEEAEKIRNTVKEKYKEMQGRGKALMIALVGGGTTGVELSTELSKYEERLGGNVEVSIFQGGPTLLKAVSHTVSEIAKKRLQKAEINVHLNSRVVRVTKDALELEDGRVHPYDVLIWTGGVRPSSVVLNDGFPQNSEKRLDVDEYLRVKGEKNVFAAGDVADNRPKLAQVAHEQGTVAGENLVRLLKGQTMKPYKYRLLGILIPLFGKYVVVDIHGMVFTGFLGYMFQQMVFLRYLLMILPPWKAFRRWGKYEGRHSKTF